MHKLRKTPEEIGKFCRENGGEFLGYSSDPNGKGRTRIRFKCRCGEEGEAEWTNFKRYPNCKSCGKAKKSGVNCYMYDPDRDAVAMRKRFRKRIGNIIHRALRAIGAQKSDNTYKLLGYTAQELQDHITGHPDYRPGEDFHIDHIWPVQAFLDYGVSDLKMINCLDNLRPMAGPENLSKADKYDKEEFGKWLEMKLAVQMTR